MRDLWYHRYPEVAALKPPATTGYRLTTLRVAAASADYHVASSDANLQELEPSARGGSCPSDTNFSDEPDSWPKRARNVALVGRSNTLEKGQYEELN